MSASFPTHLQVRVRRVLGVTAQAWGLAAPRESARVVPLTLAPRVPRRRRAVARAPFFAISY